MKRNIYRQEGLRSAKSSHIYKPKACILTIRSLAAHLDWDGRVTVQLVSTASRRPISQIPFPPRPYPAQLTIRCMRTASLRLSQRYRCGQAAPSMAAHPWAEGRACRAWDPSLATRSGLAIIVTNQKSDVTFRILAVRHIFTTSATLYKADCPHSPMRSAEYPMHL